jgi:hypothetical protein
MVKKFRVTIDSDKEKALLVHLLNKIVCFKQMKNKLYTLNLKEKNNCVNLKTKIYMISTVTEHPSYLSPQQQKRANLAESFTQ